MNDELVPPFEMGDQSQLMRFPIKTRPDWLYSWKFRCRICSFVGKTWSSVAKHILEEHKDLKREEETWYQFVRNNIEYLGRGK